MSKPCWPSYKTIWKLPRFLEPKAGLVMFTKKGILGMTLFHACKMYKLLCKGGRYTQKCEWTVSGLVHPDSCEHCATCKHQGYFIKIYAQVYFTAQPMRIQMKSRCIKYTESQPTWTRG